MSVLGLSRPPIPVPDWSKPMVQEGVKGAIVAKICRGEYEQALDTFIESVPSLSQEQLDPQDPQLIDTLYTLVPSLLEGLKPESIKKLFDQLIEPLRTIEAPIPWKIELEWNLARWSYQSASSGKTDVRQALNFASTCYGRALTLAESVQTQDLDTLYCEATTFLTDAILDYLSLFDQKIEKIVTAQDKAKAVSVLKMLTFIRNFLCLTKQERERLVPFYKKVHPLIVQFLPNSLYVYQSMEGQLQSREALGFPIPYLKLARAALKSWSAFQKAQELLTPFFLLCNVLEPSNVEMRHLLTLLGPSGLKGKRDSKSSPSVLFNSDFQEFFVRGTAISNVQMEQLTPLLPLTSISSLYLNIKLSDAEVLTLADSLSQMLLQELTFEDCSISPEGIDVLTAILPSTEIKKFGLTVIPLSIANIRALATPLFRSRVKDLVLAETSIGDEELRALVFAIQGSPIAKLNLSGNKITSLGLKVLLDSLHETNIGVLDLSINSIDNRSARYTASILPTTKISGLDLSFNRIEDEGAAALLLSLQQIRLKKLDLRGNNITPQQEEALKNMSTPYTQIFA